MSSPKFSIIVPHYDETISDEVFVRGITCLLNQTYKNFEVLIYHDGPISRPIPEIYKNLQNHKLVITDKRENNWGHGNRNRGIHDSKGEFIIHFNPDNILYDNALDEINKTIEEEPYPRAMTINSSGRRILLGNNDIIIFPILMIGHYRFGLNNYYCFRVKQNDYHSTIMTGDPAVKYNIDCMQLVMKRSLWLEYGGWYNKTNESDSIMYPKFVDDLGARYCNKVLGEHR